MEMEAFSCDDVIYVIQKIKDGLCDAFSLFVLVLVLMSELVVITVSYVNYEE